jgi:hypothetical protein
MRAVHGLMVEIDKQNGYRSGTIQILHNSTEWQLHFVHNHLLTTRGGLSLDDQRWIVNKNETPLPMEELNKIFVKHLAKEFKKVATSDLKLSEETQNKLVMKISSSKHRVWCGDNQTKVEELLHYLSKFRFHVGLHRNGFAVTDDGQVELEGRAGTTHKLSADEFIKRFVKLIMPEKFQKIRNYGLYSNASRERLGIAKEIYYSEKENSDLPSKKVTKKTKLLEKIEEVTGKDPCLCKFCKNGQMIMMAIKEKGRRQLNFQWINVHPWIPIVKSMRKII